MINYICTKCGTELKLSKFAHNQDTCFDCFKHEVELIKKRIDSYQPGLLDKRDEHKDILNWMLALVAEIYGCELQTKGGNDE